MFDNSKHHFLQKREKKNHDDMYIKIKIQYNDLKELEYVKQYEFSVFCFFVLVFFFTLNNDFICRDFHNEFLFEIK